MTNIKERILYIYLNIKEKKKEDFFKNLGFSYANFKGIQKKSALNSDSIDIFLSKFPNIDANWLLTGKGEMLKNPTKLEPLKSYPKAEKKHEPIPKLPIEAYAGLGAGEFILSNHDIEEYYLIPEFSHADFLISVTGSSMQPKYNGGDVVACKNIQSYSWFQWGVPHVIHIKDRGVVIKRPYKTADDNIIDLKSDNERYEAFSITKEEIINISMVVGCVRLE
jgi:repressor LexA